MLGVAVTTLTMQNAIPNGIGSADATGVGMRNCAEPGGRHNVCSEPQRPLACHHGAYTFAVVTMTLRLNYCPPVLLFTCQLSPVTLAQRGTGFCRLLDVLAGCQSCDFVR
mgnify:CR=1 FL=1